MLVTEIQSLQPAKRLEIEKRFRRSGKSMERIKSQALGRANNIDLDEAANSERGCHRRHRATSGYSKPWTGLASQNTEGTNEQLHKNQAN